MAYKLAVLDLETDPFLYNRAPVPFAAGFFDGDTYYQTWGDNCVSEMMDYLREYPVPLRIYAHNGGKFDFWFMQEGIQNPLMFIKNRLVKAAFLDRHEIRDSYSAIPVPLRDYKKDETDYSTFEYGVREKHKKAIGLYLQHDCEYLYQLLSDYIKEFGPALTMGGAAIKELKRIHPQKSCTPYHDAEFRSYYSGGRVQCFEHGILHGDFKFYDVNSMYPFVMAEREHPFGFEYATKIRLPDSGVYFADITCWSNGALPLRDKYGSLRFPVGTYRFLACSHELNAGIELGWIKNIQVHSVQKCLNTQSFTQFISTFAERKIAYEREGNTSLRLFMKLIMNSAYGKFATDPSRFKDCALFDNVPELELAGFKYCGDFGDKYLGEKPAQIKSYQYFDVAIAASITSAARAELMYGLANAERPIYCDTDSIVAEGLDMPLHDTKLGAWKTEAQCNEVAIAGKKMYAGFTDGVGVKKASKGVNLDYSKIRAIAAGEEVEAFIDAPNLRLGNAPKFIKRTIASTH